jgi:hypothetical protein
MEILEAEVEPDPEPPARPKPPPLPPIPRRGKEEDPPMVLPVRKREKDGFGLREEREPRRKDPIVQDEMRRIMRSRPSLREPERNRRGFGGSGFHINAGIGGGLAMMFIAVVWFVLGLMAGFIFFYPPVLFIVGLVALIKGLLNVH